MFSGSNKSEAGSDGIGDSSYIIDVNNQDNFPLMAPISVFDVGAWDGEPSVVEIVSNATISNFQLNATQKNLSFNVSRWIFSSEKTEIRRSMAKVGERVLEIRGKRCVTAK